MNANTTTKSSTRKLRILYLSHYYPPEVNAPAIRVSELAREWRKLGHEVTVQTGFPNHPHGIVPDRYRGRFAQREVIDGTTVLRSYLYATPNKGFFKRIVNYVSFATSTVLLWSWRSGAADIVIGTSPQFFVAIAGWITAVIKRAPFVFEVRDLWPEEIVAVGAIRNRVVIGALEALEMFLYRRATLIVAVAQGTIENLVRRGIPREKIALIPNGVSVERFTVEPGANVRRRFNLNGEFLVSYIGTHGMAHRLETVIDAAELLKDNSHIKFLMVGDGAEKENLMNRAKEKRLANIIFAPQTDSSEIPAFYQASDVCLAPMRRSALFQKNVPSKIYEIMASGKPTLVGALGESQQLVESAGAGQAFEPENAHALAEKIVSLSLNRELASEMGKAGRRFVSERYRRDALAEAYLSALERTCMKYHRRSA